MKALNVVHIEWLDSGIYAEWTDVSDLDQTLGVTHSVGILVEEHDSFITLVLSFDPESESVNNLMYVPKCAIIRRETLCLIPLIQTKS